MAPDTDPVVEPVPAFDDNYLWLLVRGSQAAVVDPGDAAPILLRLQRRSLALQAILVTHHHGDHVGGVAELLDRFPVPLYGPALANIPGVTHPLAGGETVAADRVIFAGGHSARDTIRCLQARGVHCDAKPFALGVRIEHQQALIDTARFGPQAGHPRHLQPDAPGQAGDPCGIMRPGPARGPGHFHGPGVSLLCATSNRFQAGGKNQSRSLMTQGCR